jgi:hypothetical protein
MNAPVGERAAPFPAATGRGVRIAVIDSGVFPNHPHISSVAGGVSIDVNGAVDSTDFLDRLGHGTAVTAAIQEKAPAAEYFAVKVFQRELRTTAAALIAAIDWSVENGMDIVNLSLGSTNPNHAQAFGEAAARAAAKGILLLSAIRMGEALCYPGSLADVIGVGLDWECPRDRYRVTEEGGRTVFVASGYPRPIPGVAPMRNLSGISFAVANMTGFVARARETAAGTVDAGLCSQINAALTKECALVEAAASTQA